jgi:hypothetical protein
VLIIAHDDEPVKKKLAEIPQSLRIDAPERKKP